LPRDTVAVDRCRVYGKRDRIIGRRVPSGNGPCLLHTKGRGGSVSNSRYRYEHCCQDETEGVKRRMDRGGGGHVVKWSYCSTARQHGQSNWRREEGSIWERDAEERPRVRLISSNPETKGDESKTRESIEAGRTATGMPKGFPIDVLSSHLSISALLQFTRVIKLRYCILQKRYTGALHFPSLDNDTIGPHASLKLRHADGFAYH
jgi:hypothetical protein